MVGGNFKTSTNTGKIAGYLIIPGYVINWLIAGLNISSLTSNPNWFMTGKKSPSASFFQSNLPKDATRI